MRADEIGFAARRLEFRVDRIRSIYLYGKSGGKLKSSERCLACIVLSYSVTFERVNTCGIILTEIVRIVA